MDASNLPLLELFTRLQDAGLPLGIDEYKLVLKSLQGGFGISDKAALKRLCQTLWVKSEEEKRLFDYHFEKFILNENNSVNSDSSSSIVSESEISQNNPYKRWLINIRLLLNSIIRRRFLILVILITFFIGQYFLFLLVNLPPKFVSQPVREAQIGKLYLYNIEAKDLNVNDVLTITHLEKPSWLNLTDNGNGKAVLQGIITLENALHQPNKYYSVKLQVTDKHGAKDIQSFDINPSSIEYNIWIFIFILIGIIVLYIILRRFTKLNVDVPNIIKNFLSVRQHNISPTDYKPYSQRKWQADEKLSFSSLAGTKNRTKTKKIKKPGSFIVNDEYFPVTRRQMKQSWRYLRRVIRKGLPTELDVDATIKKIVKQGIFLEPILVSPKVNKINLILLIDRDGSMLPFHIFSERLTETAIRGGRLQQANTYYFHNCPIEYLYQDYYFQEAQLIHDVINSFQPQNIVVLFFSDAGAARGGFNSERLKLTENFLDFLRKRVRNIAWLNPMPRSRWFGTTANEIAKIVPMFELNRHGLDNAISILRGNSSGGYRQ
ncbi:hypothetical protein A6S26_17875 [Nostoc sp. ATCC 43529]|nr:hypothetical protein A6S26_17875 [Nostoc sp. ATCC 43529]